MQYTTYDIRFVDSAWADGDVGKISWHNAPPSMIKMQCSRLLFECEMYLYLLRWNKYDNNNNNITGTKAIAATQIGSDFIEIL